MQMIRKTSIITLSTIFFSCTLFAAGGAFGYDINEHFSVGGILAGAYQGQTGSDIEDKERGAMPVQLEASFRPTQDNEFFVGFGFGSGNGLNDETEFNLAPWAANMEDDVEDINGRSRDYLLTAWYKHSFRLGNENVLSLTGGIIDSTAYLDENAFANDEYAQFMNEALVNASTAFLPSYDIGGVVEWEIGDWEFTALGMSVGENDEGNGYNYYGGQVEYNFHNTFGEGNCRFVLGTTSDEFSDENGEKENLTAAIVSVDQRLGEMVGLWARLAWQDDSAVIDYDLLYSGGIDVTGGWYGRKEDNIGLGYAFLDGEYGLDCSQVAELYWRFVLGEYFALTADFQYMKDEPSGDGDDVEGFIWGVRGTAEF